MASEFHASEFVTIQGKSYKLRPFSGYWSDNLNRQGKQLADKWNDGEIDDAEYYDNVLRLVIEDEPEWDTRAKDFNAREAENAILAFLPPSKQAYMLLTGFQPV